MKCYNKLFDTVYGSEQLHDFKRGGRMKTVTAILIGAGLRGNEAYAEYALKYPSELNIIAVADPDSARREAVAAKHNIPTEYKFHDYNEVLQKKKFADCVLVCTQDKQHYEPVMLALERGYHVLCEKPMAIDKKEMTEMVRAAEKYRRILSICHVLRYSPFFIRLKEMLDTGRLGKLTCIQHIENVGYWHFAHSFVRGNWRNEDAACPIILAKCCHDMDILLWLAGSTCTKLQSFGKLVHFKEENAPEDAPLYCMEGCAHRDTCPYYAPGFYLEHPNAVQDKLIYAVSQDITPKAVMSQLERGPYGRCVYHCDNTVADRQIVNMEFANDIHVSFTMSAFTDKCSREINLMGTKGQIKGDMELGTIEYHDFISGNKERILIHSPQGGHGGSDTLMMKEFVYLISKDGAGYSNTSASISLESHLMALAAEDSRRSGSIIDFQKYKEVCK